MEKTPQERLNALANHLERIAEQLASQERPGHVDYCSKADAARVIAAVCLDARQIVHDLNGEHNPILSDD